jgi:hypothetical protein
MDNIYKINESTFKKVSKKVFRFLYGLWFPEKLLKPLLNEIKEDRIKIQELLDELTEAQETHIQFSSILEGLSTSMEALIWSKDKNHKYIVAKLIPTTSTTCLRSIAILRISRLGFAG